MSHTSTRSLLAWELGSKDADELTVHVLRSGGASILAKWVDFAPASLGLVFLVFFLALVAFFLVSLLFRERHLKNWPFTRIFPCGLFRHPRSARTGMEPLGVSSRLLLLKDPS